VLDVIRADPGSAALVALGLLIVAGPGAAAGLAAWVWRLRRRCAALAEALRRERLGRRKAEHRLYCPVGTTRGGVRHGAR
jgi:hypothetical protein